ncbi:MAG: uracil-DNA glycosylase, partial [Bacteriovoracaceae bacterium]
LVTPICVQYGVSSELVHETKATPIRVLFLGDFPKGASDLSFQGDVRDLLLKMITAMKLKPEEFALSTIVKHHKVPDGKMKELGRESLPLVLHEIHYYRPQIVVTLGAFATSVILGTEDRLSSIHGEYFERETVSDLGTKHAYQIMPIFHPEFLLINPNMKKTTWTDLQKAMKILGLL